MRLTVLGKSPSWQDAGGACSGYLLEDGDTTVLLDCGNGVFGKLRAARRLRGRRRGGASPTCTPTTSSTWSRTRTRSPTRPASSRCRCRPGPAPTTPRGPRLIAPPGATETFRRVVGCWGNEDLIENAFELEEYEPDSDARGRPVPVLVPRGAALHRRRSRVQGRRDERRRRLVYGADSSPTDELVEFAARLPTCCWSRPRCRGPSARASAATSPRRRPASTAEDAGVKRVVMTHISDELDSIWARRRGRARRSAGRSSWRARARSTHRGLKPPEVPSAVNSRARPVRELRAHAARDRRAVRRRVRAHRLPRAAGSRPRWTCYYTDDPPRAVVKADLAGVLIEDVALEIRGRQLLIAGERRAEQAEGRLFQQIEIEHGPFRRRVELGADVVAEEAKASYDDGILGWRCRWPSATSSSPPRADRGGGRVIEIPHLRRRAPGDRRWRARMPDALPVLPLQGQRARSRRRSPRWRSARSARSSW